MASYCIETPIGFAMLQGDENGIRSLTIQDAPTENPKVVPKILLPAIEQIRAYFSKELIAFTLKINPAGTKFQQTVWQSLSEIPYGKTLTYLQLSKQIGKPEAIRAVANANAKNPLWIIIPCHRVIGSNGTLTGYAGGLSRKKWLLEHEGALNQASLF